MTAKRSSARSGGSATRSEDRVRFSSSATMPRTGRFVTKESNTGRLTSREIGHAKRSRARPAATTNLPKHIEQAVYSYIQAKRALGETTINTADIARALDIPLQLADLAIIHLQPKGVRRIT